MKKQRKKENISDSCNKKESLTLEELKRVLDNCEDLEDLVLIELGVTTGIRREDLVKVDLMNIDIERRVLTFWEQKKRRSWMVALEPGVVIDLQRYINTLPRDQRYLFTFSGRTAYNKLQRILDRAGIRKHLEFHALRRTFIRLSKQLGRDIRFVMEQTGDTARTIIEEYEGYTPDEMAEILQKGGILGRLPKDIKPPSGQENIYKFGIQKIGVDTGNRAVLLFHTDKDMDYFLEWLKQEASG